MSQLTETDVILIEKDNKRYFIIRSTNTCTPVGSGYNYEYTMHYVNPFDSDGGEPIIRKYQDKIHWSRAGFNQIFRFNFLQGGVE